MNDRARSIVMTDWASDVDLIQGNQTGFIQRLQILSLLYDEILVQDELLALSSPLSKWFSTSEGRNAWSQLMDLGTIVILRHPEAAYEKDEHRNLARTAPILARAKQIAATATKDAAVFQITPEQEAFYLHVDSCLRLSPSQSREVGSVRRLEIMSAFVQTIERLLDPEDEAVRLQNKSWLKAHLPDLDGYAIERFLSYARSPESVISDRHQAGLSTNAVFASDSRPIFNRSLAMQASQLFTSAEGNSLGQLVQSAFAAPFCWRENALGQYGNKVLPIPDSETLHAGTPDSGLVAIQAEVAVPIPLPSIQSGLSDAIAKVRASEVGLKLRDSIANLPHTRDFQLQRENWRAVASSLAAHVNHETNLAVSVHEVVNCVSHTSQVGLLVHFFSDAFSGQDTGLSTVLHAAPEVAKHAIAGLAIEQLRRVGSTVASALDRNAVEYQLEKSVEFGCVWLREPSCFEVPSDMA